MPSSKAWKEWERTVARKIGGERRGAYTGSGGQGKNDIIHDVVSAECKLLSQPRFGQMLDACHQAKENAEPGQVPIAFVRRKGDPWGDGLVVMRMEEFRTRVKSLMVLLEEADE